MTESTDYLLAKTVSNEPEARIIIGFLQAQGIQAIILEDDAGDQFPSLEETQGVKILVPDQDLETAQSLLAEREEAAANDKSGEEE